MSHWGWRRILTCFVSVLVVGCSVTSETAPTLPPTSLPPVTLISRNRITATPPAVTVTPPSTSTSVPTALAYTVQQGDTLLGIAVQFGVPLATLQAANGDLNPLALPINATIIIPNPPFNALGDPRLPTDTPVPLVLLSPNCRPTTTGGILCLGRVLNTQGTGVQRVNLDLQLLRQDGSVLAESQAGIEQGFIPSGGSAPYRALFKAEWHDYSSAAVWLESAEIGNNSDAPYLAVDILRQEAHMLDGQYMVSAVMHNPDTENAHLLQAVLTVEDASGQIVGYRVMPLSGDLPAGEDLPFEISVMAPNPVTHTLYVEAIRE